MATVDDDNLRNPTEAVRLGEHVCKLTEYKVPMLLDTLAAAYAAEGDFSKAIRTAEQAIELAEEANQKKLVEQITANLELYKAGKAYRK